MTDADGDSPAGTEGDGDSPAPTGGRTAPVGADDDPRLTGAQVRTVAGSSGTLTLVGVVHDHPASVYRVRRVIAERDPDVLALELSPLALALFERYARDERTPPARGGEMSAAIQAASTDRVVGIDGPTGRFLVELGRTLVRERASPGTTRAVAAGLLSVGRDAVACRAAAALSALTPIRVDVGDPVIHDTDRDDDPATQAADERGQIRRARAVMDALEPSRAVRFRDGARESHMAGRLRELRRRGDVVAVLGCGHLDPVADRVVDGDRG